MRIEACAAVTRGRGALPRKLAASQQRATGLASRRAAHRAKRVALDNPVGAATPLVTSATHQRKPDPSQKLDTGHEAARRQTTPDALADELIAERVKPRKHRLSIAGMGASTSGRHAREDEEMLAEGFGRDSLRSDAPG